MEIFKDIPYQDLLSDAPPIPHDVTFTFEGEDRTLPAHRLILSLASPHFRTLFYGPFEAIPHPHTIAEVDFSILSFERMLFFVYACLANKKSEYILVDEKEKISGQQDIKTVIETSRVSDFYGLSALAELCEEAMERISVTRENVEWLHSFLHLGPGEEKLQEKVGDVLQIMNQLEARREGRISTRLRSYKHQRFGDKTEEWLNHELDGPCDIIVLRGPTDSRYIGTYKRIGAHNKRPLYKMIHDDYVNKKNKIKNVHQYVYDVYLAVRISGPVKYIYYADGCWAVGDLYEDEGGSDDVVLTIPDKSINGGPPVYLPSTNPALAQQFSLSCGYPSVCKKINVACEDPDFDRPEWLGEYEATGTYKFGVMEYENSNGIKLNKFGLEKIEHNNNTGTFKRIIHPTQQIEKHICPCQTMRIALNNYELGVTCSESNCLCSHHAS